MRRFHLPSGAIATLGRSAPRVVAPGIFEEEAQLILAAAIDSRGAESSVEALPLADFHSLRAIAKKLGRVADPPIEVECPNCRLLFEVAACSTLELGPYLDGELRDPKLDASFPFGEPFGALGSGPRVTLASRTLAEVSRLHVALARQTLRFPSSVVVSMGVTRLNDASDPRKIGRSMRTAPDDEFDAIAHAFELAHYPERLTTPHACPECRAVAWVAVPPNREFTIASTDSRPRTAADAPFVSADEFENLVREVAVPILESARLGPIALVVQDGPAHLDDAGTPLLGSYVPEDPEALPPRKAEITIYFRTFQAMWDDEGVFDVRGEIRETVLHELEHHEGALLGSDPLDDEEHDLLDDELVGRVGRAEVRRRAARGLAAEVGAFMRQTWWLWLLALAATVASVIAAR